MGSFQISKQQIITNPYGRLFHRDYYEGRFHRPIPSQLLNLKSGLNTRVQRGYEPLKGQFKSHHLAGSPPNKNIFPKENARLPPIIFVGSIINSGVVNNEYIISQILQSDLVWTHFCDLFWAWLSDLHLGNQKVTLKKLVDVANFNVTYLLLSSDVCHGQKSLYWGWSSHLQ